MHVVVAEAKNSAYTTLLSGCSCRSIESYKWLKMSLIFSINVILLMKLVEFRLYNYLFCTSWWIVYEQLTLQVIIGTFIIDAKKDAKGGDPASGKLPSPIGGASVSNLSFRSPADSPHQLGGTASPFMMPHRSMQMTPSHSMDWRTNTGYGMHQSPENGDYEPIPD